MAKKAKRAAPEPGEEFRHYKGGMYTIVAIGLIEATMERVVIYRAAKDNAVWVRPYEEFMGMTGSADANMPVHRFSRV